MLNFLLNNGIWFMLVGAIIAAIGGFLTHRQNDKQNIDFQIELRAKTAENAKLQKELRNLTALTLKNVEYQNLLNSTIEWIKIKIYLENVDSIQELNGSQFLCEIIKPNILNPEIFIDILGNKNLGFNISFFGKDIDQLTKNSIKYDLWTKTDQDDTFHKLNTSITFNKGLIEGDLYISPEKQLRTLKVRDFNNGLLRLVINTKLLNHVKKIEFLLNDAVVFSTAKEKWLIDNANMIRYPKDSKGLEPTRISHPQWLLIGEVREDTYGIGPYKLQLTKF